MLGCNQLNDCFTTVIGRRAIRTSYGRIIPVPFFRFLALTVLARSATHCKQSRDYRKKSMHVWSSVGLSGTIKYLALIHIHNVRRSTRTAPRYQVLRRRVSTFSSCTTPILAHLPLPDEPCFGPCFRVSGLRPRDYTLKITTFPNPLIYLLFPPSITNCRENVD